MPEPGPENRDRVTLFLSIEGRGGRTPVRTLRTGKRPIRERWRIWTTLDAGSRRHGVEGFIDRNL